MGKILEIIALISTGRWRPVSPEETAMDTQVIVAEEIAEKHRKSLTVKLKDFLEFKA
ncbi:MAG: hypothetical protein ACE5KK_02520 [Candidatus Brocadiales bacterium]